MHPLSSLFFKTTVTSALLLVGGGLLLSQFTDIGDVSVLLGSSTPTPFADIFPDKHLVIDMMQLSQIIYHVGKDDDDNYQDTIGPKFKLLQWIDAEFSAELMIVTYDDEESDDDFFVLQKAPIVVFRGTESDDIQDPLINIDAGKEKSNFINAPDEVRVHRGFQNFVFNDNVAAQIEETVLDMNGGPEGEVIFSGHSLGGAAAQIMATYFADKYPDMKVTMINFGAPRVGNMAFKEWSENELDNLACWRFVLQRDLVPRGFPNFMGYYHAGHLFQVYKRNSEYYSEVFYRQVGDGDMYARAPRSWYCKYAMSFNDKERVIITNILIRVCFLSFIHNSWIINPSTFTKSIYSRI